MTTWIELGAEADRILERLGRKEIALPQQATARRPKAENNANTGRCFRRSKPRGNKGEEAVSHGRADRLKH